MTFKRIGEDLPETWEPESGDSIEGIYKGKQHNVGKNKSTIYNIEVYGELKSVWGSTVLDRKMMGVKEEETIRITYDGKDEVKDYKKYTVEVDKPDEETKEEEEKDAADSEGEPAHESGAETNEDPN